jgi:hypothetical protein
MDTVDWRQSQRLLQGEGVSLAYIKMIYQMASNISMILASRITSMLRRGELNPHRIGEYEKKIGFSLNLTEKDIAIAVAVWENRQKYRS